MECFEELLECNRCSVERYVRFRISSKEDADDLLQEIYLASFNNFAQLKNKVSFKAWIIGIARNQCNYYFRQKAKFMEIPIDSITENELTVGRLGITEMSTVTDTFELLGDKDKQILYLYYWKEMPQSECPEYL